MAWGIQKPSQENVIAVTNLRRMAMRQLVPLGLSVTLLLFLWSKTAGLDFNGIWRGIAQVTVLEWAMAAGLSAASFWAVGRYDAVVHRLTNTGISNQEATRAGVTAIAVAQTVGFGVVSGALVRWRMLPGLSLVQAIKVSVTVAMSFVAGWAVVAALAVLIVPATLPFPAAKLAAWLVLVLALAAAMLSLSRPNLLARLPLPSLRAMGTIVLLALVDTMTAGGALYALLPTSIHISLPVFLTAFVVALGAGLILGTPGGVGPFEVTLIALLPHVEAQGLLSAVLAFRVVYYAIPALIGAVLVIRGPVHNTRTTRAQSTILHPNKDMCKSVREHLINSAALGESGLLRHGRLSVMTDRNGGGAMVAASRQSLILLRGALGYSNQCDLIAAIEDNARNRFLTPALYKAPARLALAARRAGWRVLPVAREAVVNPQTYDTEGRAYRQLRRKLRKAENAGITITAPDSKSGDLPLKAMTDIAQTWADLRGGERGFSMGVFDPETMPHARCYLAWQDHTLIGFLSLHDTAHERVLDLIRYASDAPDGMIHLLMDHAIRVAGADGLARVSLASVPMGEIAAENQVFKALRQRLDRISGAAGLRQFKASFAPKWETLYLAAPGPLGLALAAIDISREITKGN